MHHPVGVNTLSKSGSAKLKGDVTLSQGTGVTLTQTGQDISVAASVSITNALLDGANHTDTVAQTVSRGSLIYGNSTPKWDELTIGAAHKFLRSDGTDAAWKYPGAVLLGTATASNDASIAFTLTSPANSNFHAYLICFAHVAPQTDNVDLYFRTSTNGGSSYDSGAGNYDWASHATNSNAVEGGNGSTSATQIQINTQAGNAANETSSGRILLCNPSAAQYGAVLFDVIYALTNSTLQHRTGGGRRLSAADVDAVQFSFNSGNIASGEFRLYGLPSAA